MPRGPETLGHRHARSTFDQRAVDEGPIGRPTPGSTWCCSSPDVSTERSTNALLNRTVRSIVAQDSHVVSTWCPSLASRNIHSVQLGDSSSTSDSFGGHA